LICRLGIGSRLLEFATANPYACPVSAFWIVNEVWVVAMVEVYAISIGRQSECVLGGSQKRWVLAACHPERLGGLKLWDSACRLVGGRRGSLHKQALNVISRPP
jgi:hypothetical protein